MWSILVPVPPLRNWGRDISDIKSTETLEKNRNKISTIKKAMKISEKKIINSGVPHFPQCISHPTKYQETMRNFVKKMQKLIQSAIINNIDFRFLA